MGNQKEFKTRIATINTLQQVSGAMRMVASSKLLKTQRLISELKPFEKELHITIRYFHQALGTTKKSYLMHEGKGKKALIVAIASNKGKCGSYNQMVVNKTIEHYHFLESEGMEVNLMVIGKKADELLSRSNLSVQYRNHEILENFSFLSSNQLAEHFIEKFTEGEFCRIDIVYSYCKNVVIHDFVAKKFLPLDHAVEFIPIKHHNDSESFDKMILEPTEEEISDYLIPKFIKASLYSIFLNASASENATRMTSMQKACDNARDLFKSLSLSMNKERQAFITREIVEIVSGAESMGRS